ncbi:hypothetical protein [Botrimarina sp.]|uniref:DNA topoisomerase IB n=1 Tax=Botrimarina sp. TaxID=2795802 RepID=UPI0032EC3F40
MTIDKHEKRRRRLARRANLRYVTDRTPGFTRRRCGRGFVYVDAEGERVADRQADRAKALVLPPAWEDVWICSLARGHLQATGRDARRRKQHRYHDDWSEVTRRAKFDGLIRFGERLPELRRQVDADLRRHEPRLERTAALAVAVMDQTGIRIGSREYARDNETPGVTTLQKSNADIHTTFVELSFAGKSQTQRTVRVQGRRLARHLAAVARSPGEALLRYRRGDDWFDLDSHQVNNYLRQATGEQTTAKRFRTWLGSVTAFQAIRRAYADGASPTQAARQAVRESAGALGNTIAVARRHYIHPAVLELSADEAARLSKGLDGYGYEAEQRGAVDAALLDLVS